MTSSNSVIGGSSAITPAVNRILPGTSVVLLLGGIKLTISFHWIQIVGVIVGYVCETSSPNSPNELICVLYKGFWTFS